MVCICTYIYIYIYTALLCPWFDNHGPVSAPVTNWPGSENTQRPQIVRAAEQGKSLRLLPQGRLEWKPTRHQQPGKKNQGWSTRAYIYIYIYIAGEENVSLPNHPDIIIMLLKIPQELNPFIFSDQENEFFLRPPPSRIVQRKWYILLSY